MAPNKTYMKHARPATGKTSFKSCILLSRVSACCVFAAVVFIFPAWCSTEPATMAELIGKEGIHNISGDCELCGAPCDPGAEELNCLSCTFAQCQVGVLHQDCLEKFLKRIGCEKCVFMILVA